MDSEALKESIKQYETQLKSVIKSLETESSSKRQDLIDLKTDLEQLISVSKDYLEELSDCTNESNVQANEIDDEYSNFMSEIAALDQNSQNVDVSPKQEVEDLKDNLKEIIGMKCLVTHTHNSGCEEKHLAMVSEICNLSEVQDMKDIQVKIMYTHPTLIEMLPCPYFLNGDCKFDSDECQYSHGKIVSLINLKDYDKPDYSALMNGESVLVKQPNQLWTKATVTDINNDVITISKDGKTHCIVNFEDIIPIEQLTVQDDADDSSSSDDSAEDDNYFKSNSVPAVKNISNNNSDLANWEQYTKGIGSKLMVAMGYQMGMGLGKECDGRIEPVPVQILPTRMSLDHCMKMREEAGGDENFFSINRRIRKIKKKFVKPNSKGVINAPKKPNDVFGVINNMLTNKKEHEHHKQTLKASTSKELNFSSFQLSEDIRRTEKDINKYKESLRRQKINSTAYKEIYQKLESKKLELHKLKNSEKVVFAEQRARKDKMKLDIF